MWEIHNKDVVEWVKNYKGPKFHAVLCDPPYHLTSIVERYGKEGCAPAKDRDDGKGPYQRTSCGFMGQQWDGGDVAFQKETWEAIKSVLYPGGFGMAYASSRGWHRMAVAIEDAGFIIHPTIFLWCYGSGFPKATRIDTQIDRMEGAERNVIGEKKFWGHNAGSGAGSFSKNQYEGQTGKTRYEPITEPATETSKAFASHRYGLQSLKPAVEPIVVFQRPYEGKPLENMVETGAGTLNIDAGRVGVARPPTNPDPNKFMDWKEQDGCKRSPSNNPDITTTKGRWPANFALSHLPECKRKGRKKVRGDGHYSGKVPEGGGLLKLGLKPMEDRGNMNAGWDGLETMEDWDCVAGCPINALDEQSRFYLNADWNYEVEEGILFTEPVNYCPKASREERDAGLQSFPLKRKSDTVTGQNFENALTGSGNPRNPVHHNNHPTVKPITLNQWLASLLLPPEKYAPRRLFVPFSGVASEMVGGLIAGWEQVVGVELMAEYMEIATARLKYWIDMSEEERKRWDRAKQRESEAEETKKVHKSLDDFGA